MKAPVHVTAPESRDVAGRAVMALSLAAFGSGISQRVTDPLLPRMASEFGTTLGNASWVVTWFTIGYALCQLFFGPIGDRYGKYRVIVWSCCACAVTSLLCALAPRLQLLFLARAIAGGTVAGLIPLAMAWIGDVVPYEQRQSVLARYLIGQILGAAMGQLLGGLSADYFGWRAPFVLIAGLFLLSAATLLWAQRQLPPAATAMRNVGGEAAPSMWREFALVLQTRWARVVVLTVFAEGALLFGAFAFFASHLHQALRISLTMAGAIVMCFGFGGLLFALAARRVVARLGEIGLARGGALLMFVSLLTFALVPHWWLAAIACTTLGLGFYMLHNTLQINATQMAPERRGAAVATFALCYFFGQSSGVATAGLLVNHIGTRGVILASACGIILVGLNFAREKRRHG